MDRQDLLAFSRRNWAQLAELKAEHWRERRERLGPAEGVRMAELLRQHVRRTRPDWPDARQRAEDLAHHIRLGEMLRRVRNR